MSRGVFLLPQERPWYDYWHFEIFLPAMIWQAYDVIWTAWFVATDEERLEVMK